MGKCSYCGGTLRSRVLPYFDQPWGEETCRFENVPGLVCVACGEVCFDSAVSQAMDRILEASPPPKRFDRIPVFELDLETV